MDSILINLNKLRILNLDLNSFTYNEPRSSDACMSEILKSLKNLKEIDYIRIVFIGWPNYSSFLIDDI